GDGINDVVQIDYDLLNLVGAVPVKAEVYDLSGRSLGVVLSDQMASGRFSAQWDGRDSSGKLLPPGLYLLRLSVEADKGEDARQAILSIVY
ncbi:MAG: flagellar hook assembly protein FlgD, partial [Candidatus Latescibacterota bacterium]